MSVGTLAGYMRLVPFRSLLILVAVVSIAVAGCGSNGRTAESPSTSTSAAAAPTTASTSSGAQSQPAPTSAASQPSSSAPRGQQQSSSCRAAQLKLSEGPDFGAAGTESQYLSLTNTSSQKCTLTGFPGISFVAADGRVVADNFQRATADPPPSVVTVAPGGIASFQINFGGGGVGCQGEVSWTTVRIIPPNDAGVLSTPFKGSACGGYTVHAVREGPPPSANG